MIVENTAGDATLSSDELIEANDAVETRRRRTGGF